MTKKKAIKAPEQFDEFATAKKEITERVKELAKIAGKNNPRRTIRFPVDGSRNYELESDGTLWMQYGPVRVAVNKWTEREWDFFRFDCVNNLWARLESFCK